MKSFCRIALQQDALTVHEVGRVGTRRRPLSDSVPGRSIIVPSGLNEVSFPSCDSRISHEGSRCSMSFCSERVKADFLQIAFSGREAALPAREFRSRFSLWTHWPAVGSCPPPCLSGTPCRCQAQSPGRVHTGSAPFLPGRGTRTSGLSASTLESFNRCSGRCGSECCHP